MADGIHASIRGVHELQRELQRIDKSVDRATMYAVREAGRKVKQEAKRNAPVYRAGASRKNAATATGPVRGLLRASIHSSKRLIRDGAAYGVRVAPRGERVHLYSQKIEAQHGYMAKAYAAVAPELRRIAEHAWSRAVGRR